MGAREAIFAYLDKLGIRYEAAAHPPVRSIDDCAWAEARLGCTVPKNLFLTPRNKSFCCLCLTRPGALFRTADFSRQIGASRLSFAGEDMLMEKLSASPGAVSPLGLIFPSAADVPLYMDEALGRLPRLGFHPNDSAMTIAMSAADFFDVYLKSLNRAARFVKFPDA
jgi:Ala-tRNA(Pro) deacylase